MIAWFYWDPPRELFTVPFIERPIAIYGVCFVTGFFIAYFIIAAMLSKKLSQTNHISERDIASWPALIKIIQTNSDKPNSPLYPAIQNLDHKLRNEIKQFQFMQEPTSVQKRAILAMVNHLGRSRPHLEELFPKALYTTKDIGYYLTDRMVWFVVLGTLIGARLGHVFFYDWYYYSYYPLDAFKIWEGGLASHGGIIGIIVSLALYKHFILKDFPEITLLGLLDIMVMPSTLAGAFIRIGNFFNQEILGPQTDLPWGVIFGHPIDGGPIVPRHPTQMYEAIGYTFISMILWYEWKRKGNQLRTGYLFGLCFVLVFGFRFLVEFIKIPQSSMVDETFLQTGQVLSIPFILLGIYFMWFGKKPSAVPTFNFTKNI